MKKIKGWVLKADIERLEILSNAIPVFVRNFLGEGSDGKLLRAILCVQTEEENVQEEISPLWEND